MNFDNGSQPLVDAAFLSQAIIRAPNELWAKLDNKVKDNVKEIRKSTRKIKPFFDNWILFSAMIETELYCMGDDYDPVRIDYALKQHEQWYKGDGIYGDGPEFHWDYYNSFVIQPMLVDIITNIGRKYSDWQKLISPIMKRVQRYACILEKTISPEGTFPPIGRLLTYRLGVFHLLAQIAYLRKLPNELSSAQVRCGLTTVMKNVMEAPGTFDDDGWLNIGLCGCQPDMGEKYICTGSLYLCTTIFLPLGLSEDDDFWCLPDAEWTSKRIWQT